MSIKSLKQQLTEKDEDTHNEQVNTDQMPADLYTNERFEEVWNGLIQLMKEQNNQTLYTAFKVRKPMLTKPFNVNLKLENPIQYEVLEQYKTEVVSYLRKALNNWKVSLNFDLIEDEEAKNNSLKYDNVNKFKKWCEKNPGLEALRKKFDLDIDL